ncbi:adenosine deaminase [soil metagenome]
MTDSAPHVFAAGVSPRWCPADEPFLSLPKLSLHDHLDGSIRPETLVELAAQQGVELPYTDPVQIAGWFQGSITEPKVAHWDDMFGLLTAVMRDADSIRRVAREFVLELFADGVVYGETRWAPEKHVGLGMSLDETVEAVTAGLTEGEQLVASQGGSVRVRQILCGMRTSDPAKTLEVAELTVRHYGASVVGFDIAGEETGYPASDHLAAFELLQAANIPYTIHSGEMVGPVSIADTIQLCHPERIGHGMRIIEDFTLDGTALESRSALRSIEASPDVVPQPGSLAIRVRDRQIPLELCLSSNTGFIVDSRAEHPLGIFKAMGFAVTVNPDNRLISATCVSREFRYATDVFGWTVADLLEVTLNAVAASFQTAAQREELLAEVILPAYESWLAEA